MSNQNSGTNGRSKAHVARLEQKVRDAIDATYLTGERRSNGSQVTRDTDEARAVRDYVRNHSVTDKWDELIEREAAHERNAGLRSRM